MVLPTAERLERALFISLSAVALQAVHDAEIKLGDAVSVHGMGAIGLMAIQMCQLEGIQNVYAVDPDPARRALAVKFGATDVLDPSNGESIGLQIRERNHGRGVDVAIDVSGSDRGLQGALGAAGLGATVVAAGFYQGGASNLHLGEEFHHNRLSIIASIGGWGTPNRHAPQWDRRRVLDVATRLLYTDRVSVEGLLDPDVPVRRRPRGVRVARRAPAGRGEGRAGLRPCVTPRRACCVPAGSGSGSSATACPARRCTPR